MIEIGNRMELMSSMVSKGERIGDIGTDHGLLPLKLWCEGTSPLVIMSDMSEQSLNKAKFNFSEVTENMKLRETSKTENSEIDFEYCAKEFDFRVGDGLKVFENGEVDTIIIAGMGGRLIANILEEDLTKSKSFSKYILQPRNGTHKLRQFVTSSNFMIVEEALVEEGKYICEILCIKPATNNEKQDYRIDLNMDEENILWELPIAHKIINEHLLKDFITRKINKKEIVLDKLKESKNINKTQEINRLKMEMELLKSRLI